jgi:hypothetical protein
MKENKQPLTISGTVKLLPEVLISYAKQSHLLYEERFDGYLLSAYSLNDFYIVLGEIEGTLEGEVRQMVFTRIMKHFPSLELVSDYIQRNRIDFPLVTNFLSELVRLVSQLNLEQLSTNEGYDFVNSLKFDTYGYVEMNTYHKPPSTFRGKEKSLLKQALETILHQYYTAAKSDYLNLPAKDEKRVAHIYFDLLFVKRFLQQVDSRITIDEQLQRDL